MGDTKVVILYGSGRGVPAKMDRAVMSLEGSADEYMSLVTEDNLQHDGPYKRPEGKYKYRAYAVGEKATVFPHDSLGLCMWLFGHTDHGEMSAYDRTYDIKFVDVDPY